MFAVKCPNVVNRKIRGEMKFDMRCNRVLTVIHTLDNYCQDIKCGGCGNWWRFSVSNKKAFMRVVDKVDIDFSTSLRMKIEDIFVKVS